MPDCKHISIAGCGYIGKLLARQLLKKNIPLTGSVSSQYSLAKCRDNDIPCQIIDLDSPVADISLAAGVTAQL